MDVRAPVRGELTQPCEFEFALMNLEKKEISRSLLIERLYITSWEASRPNTLEKHEDTQEK